MERNEFNQKVMEQSIFDELKDCSLRNSEHLRKKYEGLDIDFTRLYRRIINYQIKVYGCSLNNSYCIEFTKAGRKPSQRSYYRRTYEKKYRV